MAPSEERDLVSRSMASPSSHRLYGPIVGMPRPSKTNDDERAKWGMVESTFGDVTIVFLIGDPNRAKAEPGMVLRHGDGVETGDGTACVRLVNGHRLYVTDKSYTFVLA